MLLRYWWWLAHHQHLLSMKPPLLPQASPPGLLPRRYGLPSTLGKADANLKTQARRPRYRMTGSATLTGRFSAAVGTTCEASKTKPPYVFTDVIVDRLWVPFSPCGHRAPVFPSIASGYAIPVWPPIPALPVTLRIASSCHPPASRPAPPVHPRKGES